MTDFEKEKWNSVIEGASEEEIKYIIGKLESRGYKITPPEKKNTTTTVKSDLHVKNTEINDETIILVVDDNEMNLKIASGCISKLGPKVDTAKSGKEAIEKIKTKHYDLIFMDYLMPEMNGVEAAKEIKKINQNIPIIAFTTDYDDIVRQEFENVGVKDIMPKPIDIKILKNKLDI